MENYNFYQRFLHDFILGNSFIKKSLFEIEKLIYLKKTKFEKKKHVLENGFGSTIEKHKGNIGFLM